jgi:hypothetical protein
LKLRESELSQFFFHLSSKEEFLPDLDGVELTDLSDAHRRAVRLIDQVTSVLDREQEWPGWTIMITDEADRSVLTVVFTVAQPPRGTASERAATAQNRPAGERSERAGSPENPALIVPRKREAGSGRSAAEGH